MMNTTHEGRRIYGPNFDPNLVVTSALRAKHQGYAPLITIYGTDDMQRYAALESFNGQAHVLDIGHPETGKHIRLSQSTGEPVVVATNPTKAPFDYAPLDIIFEDGINPDAPRSLIDNYRVILEVLLTPYSVTVDLDSADIKGIESVPWDGGEYAFPVHPIKRAQRVSRQNIEDLSHRVSTKLTSVQQHIDHDLTPKKQTFASRVDVAQAMIRLYGWSDVEALKREVEDGQELPRFLDQFIISHAESSALLEFMYDQDICAA